MTEPGAQSVRFTVWIGTLVAIAAVAVACANPGEPTGAARLTELSVPDDARSNQVRVAPDERTIVITTSAGHWNTPPCGIVVYDGKLRRVGDAVGAPDDVAVLERSRVVILTGDRTLAWHY